MDTSTTLGAVCRSRIGKIAMAIGFALVIGGVGVGSALADGHDHGHGNNGWHQGEHDNHRNENRYRNYSYAPPDYYNTPAPDYYAAPNYYYTPPPVYYDSPPRSRGWNFLFPF